MTNTNDASEEGKKAIIVVIVGTDEELAASEHAFEKYTDYLMDIGVRHFGARDLPTGWDADPTHTHVTDTIAECLQDVMDQIEEDKEEPILAPESPPFETVEFGLGSYGTARFRISYVYQDDKGVTQLHLDVMNDQEWVSFARTSVDELKEAL